MAAKGNLPTNVTTPKFRLSYPAVFAPKLNTLSKNMEYSLQALFEKGADLSGLKAAAKNACINFWGPDESKWPKDLKSPFKDQKELIAAAIKKEQSHSHLIPGAVFMNFKTGANNYKTGKPNPAPIIVGKNPKEVITEESKFYGGCYAKANVNAGAFEKGGNAGISFYLNAAQFVADGDPFGGRPSVESAFEAIPEDAMSPSADSETGDATSMFT